MKTFIVILFIAFIWFTIYNKYLKKIVENYVQTYLKLKKVGGIKNKYSKLISYFDGFDIYNEPQILRDKTLYYEIGWAGATTIMIATFIESFNEISININIKPNTKNIKRHGRYSPESYNKINKKLEWIFDENMDQDIMYNIIINELNDYIEHGI